MGMLKVAKSPPHAQLIKDCAMKTYGAVQVQLHFIDFEIR
jgi:hypothetical protein